MCGRSASSSSCARCTDTSCLVGIVRFYLFDALKNGAEGKYSDIPIRVLGPSPAATPRINNKYRYRLIIKTKNNRRFRELLREATNQKCPRDTSVSVDINPETII